MFQIFRIQTGQGHILYANSNPAVGTDDQQHGYKQRRLIASSERAGETIPDSA
jgi:hypothetical protein